MSLSSAQAESEQPQHESQAESEQPYESRKDRFAKVWLVQTAEFVFINLFYNLWYYEYISDLFFTALVIYIIWFIILHE